MENITLNQLYAETINWTARHIIQDEIAMMGGSDIASAYIIGKVRAAEVTISK